MLTYILLRKKNQFKLKRNKEREKNFNVLKNLNKNNKKIIEKS